MEQKAYEKAAYDQLIAFIYLTNSNRSKYRTLIQGLSRQYTLGQDQYPKTLVDASSILNNHHFDLAYAMQLKKYKEKERSQSKTKKQISK